ncbi:MAG: N-acetyltransferase [Caulobacteraceae bacterium]|nr:N-acetyltransferase [Caulobacteraceae bacterium]
MTGLRDNADLGRFELDEQGHTAFADYRRADGRLIIDYVESPPPLRGAGTAGRLMTAIAEEARLEGLKIVPICGYAAAWLRRSKDYRDLLA